MQKLIILGAGASADFDFPVGIKWFSWFTPDALIPLTHEHFEGVVGIPFAVRCFRQDICVDVPSTK